MGKERIQTAGKGGLGGKYRISFYAAATVQVFGFGSCRVSSRPTKVVFSSKVENPRITWFRT